MDLALQSKQKIEIDNIFDWKQIGFKKREGG